MFITVKVKHICIEVLTPCLAYALNYGIANADSEYIARMDDDISRSDRLEKKIEFLDAHREYGFVGSTAKERI